MLPLAFAANVGTGIIQSAVGDDLGSLAGDALFGSSSLNSLYSGQWSKVMNATRFTGQGTGIALSMLGTARGPLGEATEFADEATQFGRMESHHPIPRFMGGFEKQELYLLESGAHREFHSMLREDLKAAGFPKYLMGGSGSKQISRLEHYSRHAGSQETAFNVLRRTTRNFDGRFGTSVSGVLERNLAYGRYRRG